MAAGSFVAKIINLFIRKVFILILIIFILIINGKDVTTLSCLLKKKKIKPKPCRYEGGHLGTRIPAADQVVFGPAHKHVREIKT